MTPAQLLVIEASSLARKLNDPEARRAAAMVASQIPQDEITSAGDDAHLLGAMRSTILAIDTCGPRHLHHLRIALSALIGATKVQAGSRSRKPEPHRWWIEAE